MCSTFNTVAMSLERYLMVVHPLWYKFVSIKGLVRRMICCAWIMGLLGIIPYALIQDLDGNRCCIISTLHHWTIPLALFDIFYIYLGPLLIIVYCKVRILQALASAKAAHINTEPPETSRSRSQSTLSIVTASGVKDTRGSRINQAYYGTLRTTITVAIIYILCWTLHECTVIIVYIRGPTLNLALKTQFFMAGQMMFYLNCLLNPLSYFFSFKEFRGRLVKIVAKKDRASDITEINSTGFSSAITNE